MKLNDKRFRFTQMIIDSRRWTEIVSPPLSHVNQLKQYQHDQQCDSNHGRPHPLDLKYPKESFSLPAFFPPNSVPAKIITQEYTVDMQMMKVILRAP